jgi:c-di-GMP-binding flagellar brake protein YcgR
MKDIKLKINGKLEVIYQEEDYKSNIQDITEDSIVINVPMKDGMFITPHEGEKLEIIYYEQQSVYKFDTVVIARRIENSIPQIVLAKPKSYRKIQRRQYVRVPLVSYMQYVKFEEGMTPEEVEDKLNGEGVKKGILLDLSGGGFKLKAYEDLNLGDKIAAYLECEDIKVRVTGQVVRIDNDGIKKVSCGFCFADMDYKSREQIIKIIFTLMRKQRKTL